MYEKQMPSERFVPILKYVFNKNNQVYTIAWFRLFEQNIP